MNKEQFKAALAKKRERLPVPGMEGAYARPMSWVQQIVCEKKKEEGSNSLTWMMAYSLVNENGERLFGDGDLSELEGIDAVALFPIFEVVREANNLTSEDVADLEKNSEADLK